MAGLAWQGRAHCGLDDAKNTARLLALLMHRGFRFSITDSLMYHFSNEPSTWKLPPDHPSFPSYQPQKTRDMPPGLQNHQPYCFCGVRSSKGMFRKPGPKQGSLFFGCGNWTAARGACCQYFEWALSWRTRKNDITLFSRIIIISLFLASFSLCKKWNEKTWLMTVWGSESTLLLWRSSLPTKVNMDSWIKPFGFQLMFMSGKLRKWKMEWSNHFKLTC